MSQFELVVIPLILTAMFSWVNVRLAVLPYTIGFLVMGLGAALVVIGAEAAVRRQHPWALRPDSQTRSRGRRYCNVDTISLEAIADRAKAATRRRIKQIGVFDKDPYSGLRRIRNERPIWADLFAFDDRHGQGSRRGSGRIRSGREADLRCGQDESPLTHPNH